MVLLVQQLGDKTCFLWCIYKYKEGLRGLLSFHLGIFFSSESFSPLITKVVVR